MPLDFGDDSTEEIFSGYCGDIKKFVRQKDYSSAMLLCVRLKKYISDLKKSNNQNSKIEKEV